MPQIGWFEILLIVAVAIVVIGPKDFPFVLKKVGSWIGTIKKYINSLQDQVSNLENETVENFDPSIKKDTKKKKND
jgi:sec-independent protein translocase protein TatB